MTSKSFPLKIGRPLYSASLPQWRRYSAICSLHILIILFYPMLTGRRNGLPKESPKRNIQKEKIEIDKRRKHFLYTFLYLLGEGTNRHYVPRRRRGTQNTREQNDVVGSTDTAWKRKIIWSPFSRWMLFFFYACVISFFVRDLWEFLKI